MKTTFKPQVIRYNAADRRGDPEAIHEREWGLSGFLYDAFISYATDPDYLLGQRLKISSRPFITTAHAVWDRATTTQHLRRRVRLYTPKGFPFRGPSRGQPAIVEAYLAVVPAGRGLTRCPGLGMGSQGSRMVSRTSPARAGSPRGLAR